MRDYVIFTDNTADLPVSYRREHQIREISLSYLLDGETYDHNNELPPKEFYDKMRTGSMPTTSQINPENAKAAFLEEVQKGHDILHIAFSSGLSGSYNSARVAAEEIMEEYPEAQVMVVDSLCASLGEGLLVHKVVEKKRAGATLEETAAYAEALKAKICQNFTVDDLFHLHRGGRVSKTTAIVGTLAGIKLVMHVDDEGHLVAIAKVRGRKKSLQHLVDRMAEQIKGYEAENDLICITHGDCVGDAHYVADLIKEKLGIDNVMINYVGSTIGAHSGPGTVALFFVGSPR
ncbi:MAG: DegV family protein [Lachnospiraceae bacterium]|nr:DegV family protein [Lachnospiraceae bacterium]